MEASQAEKNVFGADVKLHPVTLLPLENGIGSLPIAQQAELHLVAIEKEQGKEVADAMRHKMKADADMTTANAELVHAEHHHEEDHG